MFGSVLTYTQYPGTRAGNLGAACDGYKGLFKVETHLMAVQSLSAPTKNVNGSVDYTQLLSSNVDFEQGSCVML